MRRFAIADLVSLTGLQREALAVAQLDIERAAEAEDYVALFAPMIGEIAGRIFHHPDADVAEVPGSPKRETGFAGAVSGHDGDPVRDGHG